MKNLSKNNIIILIIILAIVASFFFVQKSGNNIKTLAEIKREEALRLKREELKKLEILRNNLANLEIEAQAVSIYDATNKAVIYGENNTISLPLASLVKTLTALLVLEKGYESKTQISKSAIDSEGEYGLLFGEVWKNTELVKFTLVYSSNDGATALSESNKDFVKEMNIKAGRIGMKHAIFLNPTGLDESTGNTSVKVGAYASADDANTLALYALKKYPEIFKSTTLSELTLYSEALVPHKIKNTNIIIDKIPNILFSKTGFTDLAGGNLTIIFKNKNDHDIAVTILGSTLEGRFVDMEKIINMLYTL